MAVSVASVSSSSSLLYMYKDSDIIGRAARESGDDVQATITGSNPGFGESREAHPGEEQDQTEGCETGARERREEEEEKKGKEDSKDGKGEKREGRR